MHPETLKYNKNQVPNHREVCALLAQEIDRNLPKAENKIWHAHPVWDAAKALANAAKHGVTFERAAACSGIGSRSRCLMPPTVSPRNAGLRSGRTPAANSWPWRIRIGPRIKRARVRLISAREATKREQRFYEEEPRYVTP